MNSVDRWVTLWLKQHGASERRLAGAIDTFFAAQVDRILSALEDFSHPTPAIVPEIFRPHDESALFIRTVHPYLLATTATGALTELERFNARKSANPFPSDFSDLPIEVQDAIISFLSELESQPYWTGIQDTTAARLTDIIRDWFSAGDSMPGLAKKIRKALGGDASKVRAMAIARTETTGAANAGHQAGYEMLADDGDLTGKTWLGAEDKDERPSHLALNNTTVPVRANFMVAGQYPAPYPGWHLLPPEQRVNCRCTTIGAFDLGEDGGGDSGADSEPEPADEEKPKRRRRRRTSRGRGRGRSGSGRSGGRGGGRGRRSFGCPVHSDL